MQQERAELLFELAICLGIPIVTTSLCEYTDAYKWSLSYYLQLEDYIVQDYRYQILEELGCVNAEDISGMSLILIQGWSIAFPTISLVLYTRE